MSPRTAVRTSVRPMTIPSTRVTKVNPRELSHSVPVTNLGFETFISYTNGFPYSVVVALRNGLSVTIPALNHNWQSSPDFVVMVRYRFARGVKIDTHRILDVIPENASMEMKALKEAIMEARINVIQNGNECVMRYSIDRQTFENHRGALYLHALDIALSLDNPERPVYHPESEEGRRIREQHEADVGLVYRICINDTEQRYGNRWANIGGRVFPVRAICDSTRLDGVYVTISGHGEHGKSEELHYPFSSAAAELMLFSTEDEARTLGNIAEERKREYENLQHEQKMLTMGMETSHRQIVHDLEVQLAKQKREKADRENDLAELVAKLKRSEYRLEKEAKKREAKLAKEKAERETRMMDTKDYYEYRSYDRKDSSEIIKWLPAVVVGAGLLISKLL